MRKRTQPIRIASALSVAVAITLGGATVALTPACQDRTCDGTGMDWGRLPGQGAAIDLDTWESSPADGKWLHFPGQRTIYFYPGPFAGRHIARVTVFISPDEAPNQSQTKDPNGPRSQYTIASGNVAVVTHFPDPGGPQNPGIAVRNDTCGVFFMRAVIEAYPAGVTPDAGADADSGAIPNTSADASVDASLEASDASSDGATDS